MTDDERDAWDTDALDALCAEADEREKQERAAALAAQPPRPRLIPDGLGGLLTAKAASDGRTMRAIRARLEKQESGAAPLMSWPAEIEADGFAGYAPVKRSPRGRRSIASAAVRAAGYASIAAQNRLARPEADGWPHASEFADPTAQRRSQRSTNNGVNPATLRELRRLHERRIIDRSEARSILFASLPTEALFPVKRRSLISRMLTR